MRQPNVIMIAAAALVLLTAAGCGQDGGAQAAESASVKEAVVVADPQKAVDEIYASLEEYEAEPVRKLMLEEMLGIAEGDVREFYGKISNPSGGLADVLILLPENEKHDGLQLALSTYKEKRMTEFEDYDILDAYPISQNAAIYNQGDYLIMLMLADNEAARLIVDEYIPL